MSEPTFTKDYFTRCIPQWEDWLGELKDQPAIFLEIGSFEGRSAIWLLENILTHPDSFLNAVDPFSREFPIQNKEADFEVIKERFDKNMKPYQDKFTLHQTRSQKLLREGRFGDDTFDAVYIDGSHHSRHCLEDMVLSFPLLKEGGVMIVDDYLWGNDELKDIHQPYVAIDSFLRIYREFYTLIERKTQVALKKND